MDILSNSRFGRFVLVSLIFALAAVTRPAGIVAQEDSQRWDGSIERLSSTFEFGWEEDPGPARMSRQPVSEDGRWIIFTMDVPTDSSTSFRQVFKRDRLTGWLRGLFGSSAAAPPVISGDGSHIAVELCDGMWRSDGAAVCDIIIFNELYRTVVNASTAPDGTESDGPSSDPVFSRDGRFVVFRTNAATLLPPGTVPGQLVLRDRDADGNGVFDEYDGVKVEVVSVSSAGLPGNGPSADAQVSADGRYVAFRSAASDLVTGDTNGAWDVFLRDRETGETRRLNVGWDGQQATPTVDSSAISMTHDGRFVAFAADDWYLLNPPAGHFDDNNALDVFVYDREAGTLQRIDVGAGGTLGNGHTYWPTFSGDGRYLSLVSLATNTGTASTAGRANVYVYDRLMAAVTRVGQTASGGEPNADALFPVISADGSFVAFVSRATNLFSPAGRFDAVYGAAHLDVAPSVATLTARGGEITLAISAQQYVAWSAELGSQGWLWPTGALWGSGPGSITLLADPNPEPAPRSATVRVGSRSVVLTQEAGLSISGVSPSAGPIAGGTAVTISGSGFEPDMRLSIGGVATPFQFVSATAVHALTPAHNAGLVQVVAETTDQRRAARDGAFEYLQPASVSIEWTAPEAIVYGTALTAAQLNATANVAGSFVYSPAAGEVLPAGSHVLTATFTPDDASYASATASVLLDVGKATPVVQVTGGTFTYDGQPHAASASVTGVGGAPLQPVVFSYDGSAAVPLNAGSYTVVASFPGDANYTAASGTASLTIEKATAVVIAVGGTFTYDGLPHAATVWTTGVGGVALASPAVTYNDASEPPVNAGVYDVVASFAGADNYHPASANTRVTIDKATPVVTVTAGTFTYNGGPHAATATVTGAAGESLGPVSIRYDGFEQPPVNAGIYQVTAAFGGDANHRAATGQGTLTIRKATPSVSVAGGTFTYTGAPHYAVASAAGVAGEALGPLGVTYNGATAAPVNAGSYAVVATYDGSANYLSVSATATLIISKAVPVIAWAQPAPIVYGTALGATQLNATASTAGRFVYSPAAGTVLPAAPAQPLMVEFTPADPGNYTAATAVMLIAINPAPLEVRANDAIKKFAAPLPTFTATITGFVNGDSQASLSGTLAFATTATTLSPPGTYPIVPSGVSSPNYVVRFVNGTLTIYRGANSVDDSDR